MLFLFHICEAKLMTRGALLLAFSNRSINTVIWQFSRYVSRQNVEFVYCRCAVVGELKPANQLVNPQASDAAAAVAGSQGAVPVGLSATNCGVAKTCLPDEFSVHVFSGKENVEGPRMCINGN